jgi:hypothetical protein
MLKKIILLSSALILSACATSPEGISSEQFATSAKLTKGYNFTQVTGEKIRPINLTEKNGLLVMSAEATLGLMIGEAQISTLALNLKFLENYQKYYFARINDVSQKITQRKETVRQCDDQCSITQYILINIKTDDLLAAREQGLVFSINKTDNNTDFIFKIPSNYIDGLLKRYEVENTAPIAPINTLVSTSVEESKAIEMTQYWFNKLDSEEQIAFSTWAIKSSKKEVVFIEGSKNLEKLHYWYQEATKDEQKNLRTWAVGNLK